MQAPFVSSPWLWQNLYSRRVQEPCCESQAMSHGLDTQLKVDCPEITWFLHVTLVMCFWQGRFKILLPSICARVWKHIVENGIKFMPVSFSQTTSLLLKKELLNPPSPTSFIFRHFSLSWGEICLILQPGPCPVHLRAVWTFPSRLFSLTEGCGSVGV